MHIKTIQVGELPTNCYVVTDPETKSAAIIDPGDEGHEILAYLAEFELTPRAIFLTHGHYDHTMAVDDIVRVWEIPVYIHKADTTTDTRPDPYLYTIGAETVFYEDGDEIEVGTLTFRVVDTPGHSAGSVCLLVEDCLFTGDTLFRDDCGRMDLPGGDGNLLSESLEKLYKLEDVDEVFPGHMDATTMERERRFNSYLRRSAGL